MNTAKGKVIFLDVDGVLATSQQIHEYAKTHGGHCPPGYPQIDMKCVYRLFTIAKACDASIVVSSTWRKHKRDMLDLMKALNRVVDAFVGVSIDNIDSTPVLPRGNRGEEILAYCKSHDIDRSDILVLDDDIGDLHQVADRHIRTDYKVGLTDEDVTKAIKLLKGGRS